MISSKWAKKCKNPDEPFNCRCNILQSDGLILGLVGLKQLQLRRPSLSATLLTDTQASSTDSEFGDVRKQISLGRCRERLNTRWGECHCLGDLHEGFYVFSWSLAAAEHQCWVAVKCSLLLFYTARFKRTSINKQGLRKKLRRIKFGL